MTARTVFLCFAESLRRKGSNPKSHEVLHGETACGGYGWTNFSCWQSLFCLVSRSPPKNWAWRFLTVTLRTLHYQYFSCFSRTTSLLFVFCVKCLWWGFQWSAKCPGGQAQSKWVCIAASKSKKPHRSNIARHNFNTRFHQGHPWSKDTSTRTCEVLLLNLGTLLGSNWSTKRETKKNGTVAESLALGLFLRSSSLSSVRSSGH